MARIKLSFPETHSFTCIIPVRITDVNYGGHVGNDSILSIIHEARMQFLNHYGYNEMNFGGAGLIMFDVVIEFKKEAFYGEEIIVSVAIADFEKISFDVFYRLEKKQADNTITVAIAKTGMICYDYNAKKVIPIPQNVIEVFKG